MKAHQQLQALRESALAGKDSHAGLRHVLRVLEHAEAYVGKAMTEGVYEGCVVAPERVLEMLGEVRAILDGCYEHSKLERTGVGPSR